MLIFLHIVFQLNTSLDERKKLVDKRVYLENLIEALFVRD